MLRDLILRLRSLFKRDAVERELDDELRFHLEQQVDVYVRQGLSREDAERRARLAFGGLEQIREEHRDARGIAVLSHAGCDIRHALRQFRRSPGFTALAVLCLGLAIGVNTSIFGVLNSVLLRPMPVTDPDRLIVISRGGNANFSYLFYRNVRERAATLAGLAAALPSESDLDIKGDSRFVAAEAVSGSYARVIGVSAALGRWFTTDDEQVAVISHSVWEERFHRSPDVIGQRIKSESQSYTIVGVAPREYSGIFSPLRTDLWVPIRTRPQLAPLIDDRERRLFMVFGRMNNGATLTQAASELNAIDARIRADFPTAADTSAPLLAEQVRGFANPINRRRPQVMATFLMALVGLVLLIACVNVGHLLLVRGAVRRREFAVRRALGASRGRVLRQLMTESLLLAFGGGICGLVLAQWTTALLERSLPLLQGIFALQLNFAIDWRVIAFATFISLVTTIVCGLLPAWRTSGTDGLAAFKGDVTIGGSWRRPIGLVAQVVMSFVLLLVAGTFVQALVRMQTADPGFAVDGRLYAYTYISTPGVTPGEGRRLYAGAIEQLRGLPGVRTAALSYSLPLMPTGSDCVALPGGQRMSLSSGAVEPGYFATMEIRMLEGRDFTATDVGDSTVVVVNERLAAALWPNGNVVGERVLVGCRDASPATVIGVVENTSIRSLGEVPRPHVYYAFAQHYGGGLTAMVIETTTPPAAMVEPVRRTLLEIGQGVRVYTVEPLSAHVDQSVNSIRWQTSVVTTFGLLALILAAIGLYGVITYRVALRTRDIGVRMALGAGRRVVFREVVGQGLSIAVIGVAIGELMVIVLGRALGSLDSEIQPPGIVVMVATGLTWLIVAVVATYVPAARAAGVNPLIALRYE